MGVSSLGPGLAVAISILLALSGRAAAAPPQAPLAATDLGVVRGQAIEGQVRFLGIPFATPPVGELRWTAPRPARPWSGVREAIAPAPGCIQAVSPIKPEARYAEDCLYLNVYAPRARGAAERLPVMVWVYGGGFSSGAGDLYDAGRFAEAAHVVVVTLNYRLGVMGYFGYPGLPGSGDFGLQDQQAALKWVRRNAGAFGGDPHNLTLFGESAGAMSVCAQLVSPGARGAFDKAILQSGSCIASWPAHMIWPEVPRWRQFLPIDEVKAAGSAAAVQAGCKAQGDLACLRALPVEAMTKVWTTAQPAFGGVVLPQDPGEALRAGRQAPVPVIWGGTHDEWRSAGGAYLKLKAFGPEVYSADLRDAFGARAAEVEAHYPIAPGELPIIAWSAVATDVAWSCPTLESVRLASARAPAYHYEFDDRQGPNPGGAYDLPAGFPLGAAHATELAYFFDLGGGRAALSPQQARLADIMIGYWSAFAHTGDPNGPGLPRWDKVSGPRDRRALILDPSAKLAMGDFSARHQCDFWDSFKPY